MNAKTRLLKLLQAHHPADEKEAQDKEQMMVFADTLANPLSRTELTAHFTGSSIIVHPDQKQVCLIYHGKLKCWMQLGGHGEPQDEGDISATALRESREESGLEVEHFGEKPCLIDLDIHSIPERGSEPAHLHLDMRFLIQAKTDQLKFDPKESGGIRWVQWDEAIELVDPSMEMKRMLRKAKTIVLCS